MRAAPCCLRRRPRSRRTPVRAACLRLNLRTCSSGQVKRCRASRPSRRTSRRTWLVWSKTRRRTMLAQPGPTEPEPEQDPAGWGTPSLVVPTRQGDPLVDEVRAAEHLRLAGCRRGRAAPVRGGAQSRGHGRAAGRGAARQRRARAAECAAAERGAGPMIKVMALIESGACSGRRRASTSASRCRRRWRPFEAARAEQGVDAPIDLAAELAQAIAGVCFDLGDPVALARALVELESASAMLTSAGDTLGVAVCSMIRPRCCAWAIRARRCCCCARRGRPSTPASTTTRSRCASSRRPSCCSRACPCTRSCGPDANRRALRWASSTRSRRSARSTSSARRASSDACGRRWVDFELRRGRIEPARLRLEAAVEVLTQLGDLTGLATATEAVGGAGAVRA